MRNLKLNWIGIYVFEVGKSEEAESSWEWIEWINGEIDPVFLRSGTVGWGVAFGKLQLALLNFDNCSFSINTDTISNGEDLLLLLLWPWIWGNDDGSSVVNLEIGYIDEISKCCRVRKRRKNVRNAGHCWSKKTGNAMRVFVASSHFCWNWFDSILTKKHFVTIFQFRQTETNTLLVLSRFLLAHSLPLFLSFQPFISYEYFPFLSLLYFIISRCLQFFQKYKKIKDVKCGLNQF